VAAGRRRLRNGQTDANARHGISDLSDGTVVRVEHLMSLDAPEFLRLLPIALAGHAYTAGPGCVEMGESGDRVAIRYENAPPLRIASLQLPRLRVTFEFRGDTRATNQAFLEAFLKHYRRGGG
jgi:hypothetical protein